MYTKSNTYHPFNHERFRIDRAERIDSMATIRALIKEINDQNPGLSNQFSQGLNNFADAEVIRSIANNPSTQYESLGYVQSNHQNWQTFDFLPSNLGRGYLFYFICDRCDKKVKYLYRTGDFIFRCRSCSNLFYPSKRRARDSRPFSDVKKATSPRSVG